MRFRIPFAILALVLVAAPGSFAQASSDAIPRIVEHAKAIYPAIAKTAHIQGDVIVKFTTNGRAVLTAEASSGPDLLQQVSIDNVKTWKFAAHTAGTFQVIFRYKLLDAGDEEMFPGPRNVVEIVAVAPTLQTDSSNPSSK